MARGFCLSIGVYENRIFDNVKNAIALRDKKKITNATKQDSKLFFFKDF